MKMNLFELVSKQHGAAATRFLGEVLQQNPDQLRGSVDSSINTVLDGFSSVAGSQGGRELLYEAVRYSDDAMVEDPAAAFRDRDSRDVFTEANNRLTGLVGISNKDQMVASLRSRTDLSEADAENMLGYVAPGVLGVLKRQISRGDVLDNPDGIGQLFLGEGDISRVDTSKRPVSGGASAGTGAAVAAHDGGSDMSWLVRFAMPAILLGGLVLAGLSNCGNRAEQRIVADQRSKLQSELDTARLETEEAQSKVLALQGDIDAATAQSTQLTAQTDTLTADLGTANARVGELEAELTGALAAGDSAKAELETANATIEAAEAELAELNARADTLSADLETARSRVTDLEGELDTARQESTALQGQVDTVTGELSRLQALPTDTTALQGLLSDVTAERDASLDASALIEGKLKTAVNERDFARGKITQLESELGKAVGEIASRDEQLQEMDGLRAELDSVTAVRDEAVARNGEFETTTAEMQQQLDAGTRQITDLETRLRTSTERLAALDTQLSDTSQMLQEEQTGREVDISRLTSESSDLQGKLSEMLGLRDEAVSSLAMRDSEVTSLGERVNELQAEIQTLEAANAGAKEEAAALQQQIDSLSGELQTTQAKVDETNTTLTEREASLSSVGAELDTANDALAGVTAERDELLNKRDALASRIEELMSEKDTVVAETEQLKGTIDTLNGELTAAKQFGADSENKLGLLNESMGGLEKELRLITGARDEASEQARTFRAEAAELKKQITQLQAEQKAAKAAHDDELKFMQTERDQMGAQQESLRGEIATLNDDLTETQEKLQQATDDLAALNEEKAAAMAALNEARDKASEEISVLNEEVETLKGALDDEQSNVTKLNDTIGSLETANTGITGERDEALGKVSMLEAELSQSAEQVASIDDARNQLQKQVDDAAAQARAKIESTRAVRDAIAGQLAEAGISTAAVSSIENDTAVAVTLGSGDLYNVGSARLSPGGNDLLSGVGDIIEGYPEWRIDVEGHTDSQGIGAELRKIYPTNWELSTARASAAVRYLSARAGIDAERISARGFGDTRPIASNESADGREQNRRVEIVLRQ
jgi:chemotaxis protein MotB